MFEKGKGGIRMGKKQKQTGIKGLIIGIILVCLVLGYYFYLSQRAAADKQEETVKVSAVQEVLLRNLETNYPPTPREVIKVYCQIAQCLHNETYSDVEFQQLAAKIQMLYDEELIENSTQEEYLLALKSEVEEFNTQEIVISSYQYSSSTDVDEFKQDGYSWARLQVTITLRKGTQLSPVHETFLLRKDEDGHWKIYGWELADQENSN